MARFAGYLACPNEGCGHNSKLFNEGAEGELRCPAHEHVDGMKCKEHKHRFRVLGGGQGMRGWDKCPDCSGTQFTTFWRGYVVIIDPEKSQIAGKMGINSVGKHALRLSR